MPEAENPSDYFDGQPRMDVGAHLYAAATRRDRGPGPLDESSEEVALLIEELSAKICSRVADSSIPLREEHQSGAFIAILIEAVGIVRQRSPDIYEVLVESLIKLDPKCARLRDAMSGITELNSKQFAKAFDIAMEPVWRKAARDKTRMLHIGIVVGGLIGMLGTFTGVWLGERGSRAPSQPYHVQSFPPESFHPPIRAWPIPADPVRPNNDTIL